MKSLKNTYTYFALVAFVLSSVVFSFMFAHAAFAANPTGCPTTGNWTISLDDPNKCINRDDPTPGNDVCKTGYNTNFASGLCEKDSPATGGGTGAGGGTDDGTGGSGESPSEIWIPSSPYNDGLAGEQTLGGILVSVIQMLLLVSGVISVVLIIVGGFQYILSRGNQEAADKGKKTLSYAIIGLIVIVMSFVIVRVVVGTVTGQGIFGTSNSQN